jgi:hypothetical protein
MKCTALSIDDVMIWIDVFCETTGTKPSQAAQVYAEMGLCKYFEDIVAQVVYRAYTMTDMKEEELSAAIEAIQANCIERISDDAQRITFHHLEAVLIHHGIRKGAAHQLMQWMNPLSECTPRKMVMEKLNECNSDNIIRLIYLNLTLKRNITICCNYHFCFLSDR